MLNLSIFPVQAELRIDGIDIGSMGPVIPCCASGGCTTSLLAVRAASVANSASLCIRSISGTLTYTTPFMRVVCISIEL